MKAIKLASIFAVSAVAAAVSTTTFAADGVFSGSAGMYLNTYDTSDNKYTSDGELNIIMDTGVVYIDMDMGGVSSDGTADGDTSTFVLDEAYVTQGAVQFGDFDGSLIDAAVMYGGVEEGNDISTDGGSTLGVRYAVSDELTVAFEAEDGSDDDGFAASYSMDLGVASVTISGGTAGDDSAFTAGVEMPVGGLTLAGYVQQGEVADADIASMGIGADFAVSDALSISAALLTDSEAVTATDASNIEISAFYTAGDIEYVATYVDYTEDASSKEDYMIFGARASF